eukprot:1840959-Pyramimonas_sp.AAC.1
MLLVQLPGQLHLSQLMFSQLRLLLAVSASRSSASAGTGQAYGLERADAAPRTECAEAAESNFRGSHDLPHALLPRGFDALLCPCLGL